MRMVIVASRRLAIVSSKPLYLTGIREEPGIKRKRINVAIELSGVSQRDSSMCVKKNGLSLELSVTWQEPLVDLQNLMQNSKSFETNQQYSVTSAHS